MQQKTHTDFRKLEQFTRLLDSKYRLPGTKFKFGLDPIIGLIPIIGDSVTMIISGGLVIIMARNGVSGKVIVKMVGNVVLDAVIGSIPIVGSLFDFVYKANAKNMKLLKEHYEEGKHQGSGIGIIIGVLVVIFILFVLLIAGFIELVTLIF